MASAVVLSRNDKNVLSALFDAEGIPSKEATIHEGSCSISGMSPTAFLHIQQQEASIIRPLNTASPSTEQIQQSIERLSALIAENRAYASAWNNRAQAVRMLVGDDITESAVASSTLYSDLSTAIQLSSPSDSSSQVSKYQSKTLASAHTHRGHLLYKASKTLKQNAARSASLPEALKGADAERLERMAAADFRSGGKYGNEIAKQLAIQLNPYAKLCGEIVREAMVNDLRESGILRKNDAQTSI